MQKKLVIYLAAVGFLMLGILLVYRIPFVHEHLAWRLDDLRARIKYAISPPEEAVFVPQGGGSDTSGAVATVVQATLSALTPRTTSSPTAQTQQTATAPEASPTPLPEKASLPGVVYVDQHNRWNYCGPANLAMALNFWGWKGTRDDIAAVVKPGIEDPDMDFIERGKTDKNVMPYELVDYVNDQTEFRALSRFGGDETLIKKMVANGFPVLIEKGYSERDTHGKISWMGHYLFITGYDDSLQSFIVQDAYLTTGADGTGKNLTSDYASFQQQWRSFDYIFMLVYPPDREQQVLTLLGNWSDSQWADQHALDIADQEITATSGIDQFFAWFNKGTSHVQLLQYSDAAAAYDQAFSLYAGLGSDDTQRPYRIMWYQSWPYWAYYYTGRYQDVVSLADTTLNESTDKPTLEESLYWRGMAEWALGDMASAIKDIQASVYYNPNFSAGKAKLAELGVNP